MKILCGWMPFSAACIQGLECDACMRFPPTSCIQLISIPTTACLTCLQLCSSDCLRSPAVVSHPLFWLTCCFGSTAVSTNVVGATRRQRLNATFEEWGGNGLPQATEILPPPPSMLVRDFTRSTHSAMRNSLSRYSSNKIHHPGDVVTLNRSNRSKRPIVCYHG